MARPPASGTPDDGPLPVTRRYEMRRRARALGVEVDVGLRVTELGQPDPRPDPRADPAPAPRRLPPPG